MWILGSIPDRHLVGAGIHWATAPRVSMALGTSRCCTKRCLTVTSAFWKAASTSPLANFQLKAMIAGGALVQLRRAGSHRLLLSGHDRQRLVVHLDQVQRITGNVGSWSPPPRRRRRR